MLEVSQNPLFLGIDLGTSSVKVLLLALEWPPRVIARAKASYPTRRPSPNWAEQRPKDWWRALRKSLAQVLSSADAKNLQGIGLSGQMHGLVVVDKEHQPLRDAIIWADGRAAPLLMEIRERVPPSLWPRVGGPPSSGFAATSLVWLQRNEPELLKRAKCMLLPKDWLRLQLTGRLLSEPSDASASFLYDVVQGGWSKEVMDLLEIDPELLPPLLPSVDVVGAVDRKVAQRLGLPEGIPVVAGSADQAAAALGNGVFSKSKEAEAQLMLGTGGQILYALDRPLPDTTLRTHLFCHALQGHWYRLGATLNVGSALAWLTKALGLRYDSLLDMASRAPAGAAGVVFKPYLLGERTPYMNPWLHGGWYRLRAHHHNGHLARAGLEGIAYSLREALDATNIPPGIPLKVSGGGVRSTLFVQILADILGRSLHIAADPDASAWGAALAAGLGVGAMKPDELDKYVIPVERKVNPGDHRDLYEAFYNEVWRSYA